MDDKKKQARIAGVLYFSLFLAPLYLVYIPNTLIVPGDAAATASRILASETLFRFGMFAELFTSVAWIFLAMALYRLFGEVDRMLASLMVILGAVVCAPIAFINVLSNWAALTLLKGGTYLSVFNKDQLQALALFFVGIHGKGVIVSEVFWGLWLVPFGLLVIRSGFIPKILGVLLIINCVPYVVAAVVGILAPEYLAIVNKWAVIPETGELWIGLWLVIVGVRTQGEPLQRARFA